MNNSRAAVFCRSLALFIILYQFRFLSGELADTPVFIAALAGAFLASYALAAKKTKPLPSLVTLLLVPVFIRLFISIPRFFLLDTINAIVQFDSLLLNYDRNTFVSLFPFYWFSLSNFLCCYTAETENAFYGRRFLRFSVLFDLCILITIFSVAKSSAISFYRMPVLKLTIFISILILQLLSLMFSLPVHFKPQKKEFALSAAFLALIALLSGILLVRPLEESALEQGGGLLQPKIFDFDFAPFLKLETEITMNDDLIFIVRKILNSDTNDYDDHYLMRRFVLSVYNTGGEKEDSIGFLRNQEIDELSQSARLPKGRTNVTVDQNAARIPLVQEYYLVNIDGQALIAMNEPNEIVPFEKWDASSFKSAYSVNSMVSDVLPIELKNSVSGDWNHEKLSLTEKDYAYYTAFGDEKNKSEREIRIKELTENLTKNRNSYFEKIEIVYRYLKYGQYRYSLKPGIATGADQLSYFLFDSKKGYCSYFAFAFASMLRSINIPCRVAVGFFLDPEEDRLGFFPVRSNMAHAWVEVWFPKYGWIEFDPTTKKLAEGEEFQFSMGFPSETFERLMKEILDNHNRLKEKETNSETEAASANIQRQAEKILRSVIFPLVILFVILLSVMGCFGYYLRSCISKDNRKKTLFLWLYIKRALALAGYKKFTSESEGEYTERLKKELQCDVLTVLFENSQGARFSNEYTQERAEQFKIAYLDFSKWYKKTIPAWRRVLSCICPALVMLLKPKDPVAKKTNKTKHIVNILFLCGVLLCFTTDIAQTQEEPVNPAAEANSLYREARMAQLNEFWERAIELYTTGKNTFPIDTRFSSALGDLYFSRDLFRLAMDEYLLAEKITPDDTILLYKLAQTAGNLNENKLSARYLERLIALDPNNGEAIGGLGWMYFKTHRLLDGERLLLDAIDRLGSEPDFLMTLATIYSDMLRYEDSKYYYMEAINTTMNMGYNSFTSIAYYNLSILESRFYRYSDAWQSTLNSLEQFDRASGHLARGELNLRKLDFKETFSDYQNSYEYDKSPLTKLNMAEALLITGRIDEALAYSLNSYNSKNLYWMLNYGIDPIQYKRDLLEIMYKSYSALAQMEGLKANYGFSSFFTGIKNRIAYNFKAKVNKILYRKYCMLSANSIYNNDESKNTIADGQKLEALKYYYNAFADYKKRSLFYLLSAEEIEVLLAPKAQGSYFFEIGKLTRKEGLLNDALEEFDPIWEQDMIADCYVEIAKIAQRQRQKQMIDEVSGRLFSLNRGALLQNGIKLPIFLDFKNNDARNVQNNIRAALKKSGFTIKKDESRFSLRITLGQNEAYCELYDGGKGIVSFRKSFPLISHEKKDIYDFANTLSAAIFTAD